jgi:DNA-binding NtrC family response regulator
LPPEVIEALLAHDYPGNIRELRNIIERAVILAADGPIGPEHLVLESGKGRGHHGGWSPSPELGCATGHGLASARRRIDATAVLTALEETGGHRARAAHLLGVSERTLYRYVRRLRAEET